MLFRGPPERSLRWRHPSPCRFRDVTTTPMRPIAVSQCRVGLYVGPRIRGQRSLQLLAPKWQVRAIRPSRRPMSSGPAQSSSGNGRWKIIAALAVGMLLPTVWKGFKGSKKKEGSGESLNPVTFTPYTLVSKEPVSSSSAIFTLRLDRPSSELSADQLFLDQQRSWPERAIWSVQIKQPQLQIGRSYTPLPPPPRSSLSSAGHATLDDHGNVTEISLLVRREQQGEVSNYIHGLPLGSSIELRGPHIEYVIPEDVDKIVFLAGGTGIAPAIQAAHCLLTDQGKDNRASKPQIQILWANRRREDCVDGTNSNVDIVRKGARGDSWSLQTTLGSIFWRDSRSVPKTLPSGSAHPSTTNETVVPSPTATQEPGFTKSIVDHLESLRNLFPGRVTIDYFIDEENTFITRDVLSHYLSRDRVPYTSSREMVSTSNSKHETQEGKKGLILISGPDGFVSTYAGPKTIVPVPVPAQSSGLASTQPPGPARQEVVGGVLAGMNLPLIHIRSRDQQGQSGSRIDEAFPDKGQEGTWWVVHKL